MLSIGKIIFELSNVSDQGVKKMNSLPAQFFWRERIHFGAVAMEIREEQAVYSVNLMLLRTIEQFTICRSQFDPLTSALMGIMTQISF